MITENFENLYTKYITLDDYNKLNPLEKESSLLQSTIIKNNNTTNNTYKSTNKNNRP